MKHLTFLFLLFSLLTSSCSFEPATEISGKVTNATHQSGKATFQLNGAVYTVGCLESQFNTLTAYPDKNVTVSFNRNYTEIVSVEQYIPVWKMFALWSIIFGGVVVIMFFFAGTTKRAI